MRRDQKRAKVKPPPPPPHLAENKPHVDLQTRVSHELVAIARGRRRYVVEDSTYGCVAHSISISTTSRQI